HGLFGSGLGGGGPLFQFGVYGLDHHYGIVHHDPNGQDHGKEGQHIDGVSKELQEEKATHNGHRNRNGRDQGGLEVLEEPKDHQEHQDKGLDQGRDHLVDGGVQEVLGVEGDDVFDPFRKFLGGLGHDKFDLFGDFTGIGA